MNNHWRQEGRRSLVRTGCNLSHSLVCLNLPDNMGLFTGFDRPAEAIAIGERAAEASLSEITALLG